MEGGGELGAKGGSSEGEHGEIKATLQSGSLVGLLEGWWLSAGMRTNTDASNMWRGGKTNSRKTHGEAATEECRVLFNSRFTSALSSGSLCSLQHQNEGALVGRS